MNLPRVRASFAATLAATLAAALAAPCVHAQESEPPSPEGPGSTGRGMQIETIPDHPPPGPLPRVRWYTLDTPHFHVHFYGEERAMAEHAAIIAERAFKLNTRYLNWRPSGRINLTIEDQTDFADGYASSVPYNYVFGFAAPPGALDELNDFDDFIKLLITHEMTHVVHLDTILGFARFYNFIFGKLYSPNLSQPNWWVEGLAVLMESRQTTGGRIRSTLFDMELRVPFLENRLLGLDNVSNQPLVFPQGTAAYLYGSSILKYVEDRYGPAALQEISHRYGGALIPGAINRVTSEAIGKGYTGFFADGIWDGWKRSQSHKYALEVDDARRRGITIERRITYDAPGPRGDGFTPSFARDGTILYHRANTNQAPAFVRLDPQTGQGKVLAEVYGAGHGVLTPDGRTLVYSRQSLLPLRWRIAGASNLSWNDLFALDLATGEERELTRARRAEEPMVSPDGKQIACTVGGPGTRELALVPITGGVPLVLGAGLPGLAYTPTWSPDGRHIAYSRWEPGGYRDIHIYDLDKGVDRELMHDRAMDMDPEFTPDGRFLLFTSDRTGIHNIYAYELETNRLAQVTNVLAGAFQPTVSPDGKTLVYMGFTSAGFDLFTTPLDPWSWLPAQPFANTRPDAPSDPASVVDSPDAYPGEPPVNPFPQQIAAYEPWKYLYPHNWQLKFLTDPFGIGDSAEFQFAISDPVAKHTLSFDAIVPANFDASLRLDYSYTVLWPAFGASLSRTSLIANDLIIDGTRVGYVQRSVGASVYTSLPVLRTPASSGDMTFGYAYFNYGPANHFPVADPTRGIIQPPAIGPDNSLFMSWSYSNAHAWPYSISLQEGRVLSLNLGIADPSLGGRYHGTVLNWAWREYMTPPWARLHALGVLYSGGISIGDRHGLFGLGGYVEQDLLRSLFLNQRQCCTYLRGYSPNVMVGDQYHLLSAEYRAPLLWFERGYSTFPLYLRRLNGAVFGDAGEAFFGSFKPGNIRYGVGAEVRLSAVLVYYIETELQIGFARGLSTGGSNHYYIVSTFPF